MTYDDHVDCDTQLNEAEEQILNLKAELKKKDELLFAYESVKAPVNPLLAENKRLEEVLDEIEAVSCGETQIECDGVYDDSDGMRWIYKRIQVLKGKSEKDSNS